jgi:hypothetical protein
MTTPASSDVNCDRPCPSCVTVCFQVSDERSFEQREADANDLLLQIIINLTASPLDLIHEYLTLSDLLSHELNSALEHETLGTSLTLETRHKFCQAIEAFPYRLPSFLLCK